MGNGKPCGWVFVGDDTAVVDAGQSCHHIALDGKNVALRAAECITAGRCDRSRGTTHIPLYRCDLGGSDLVGGGADHIKAGCQHQVGGCPAWGVSVVVGIEHLGLCQIGADVPGKGQGVIVVNNGKLTLCFAHVSSSLIV